MSFDLSTAQPADANGFDLSTAQPAAKIHNFDAVNGQLVPTGSPEAKAARDPSAGASTLRPFGLNTGIPIPQGVNRFLAGAGKATEDIGRGLGQMIGLESRADVQASRTRDVPLMNTGAGKAGVITGTVADLLPTAFIPGANTIAGSAAIGAGTGLAQPSTSTGETIRNTIVGGVLSPAALLAGRGLAAAYQGAKGAIEPLFRGGQERVAARTLQAFAGDPAAAQAASANLANAPAVLPGVQPTAAEIADNAGIAQLERSLRNNPEYLNALTARNQANRAAMTTAIENISGTPALRDAAIQARSAAAAPLYQQAAQTVVPADAQLGQLLARPSMASAWERAQRLAAENGVQLAQPSANDISGQTLQYLKMALGDLAEGGVQQGMGAHEQRAIRGTLTALNDWIQGNVPALRQADQAFRTASAPINQMDVATQLRDKLLPALSDFGNNTRLNAASYASALRNGDRIAADVTGLGSSTLANTMTAPQMTTLRQVGEQLARRANADELGRAVGSNTGQNLVSQNVIRQFLGPLGLPQGLGERAAQSTLGQTVLRPAQWIGAAAQPRIMDRLAQAALNPQEAARLLQLARNNPTILQALLARQGLLSPAIAPAISPVGGLLGSADASQ